MAPKNIAPPTHVSDHECYDCGMSDILRHDTLCTFVREHTKQNNRISIYFQQVEVKFSFPLFYIDFLKPSFIINIYNDISTNIFTSNGRLFNCLFI